MIDHFRKHIHRNSRFWVPAEYGYGRIKNFYHSARHQIGNKRRAGPNYISSILSFVMLFFSKSKKENTPTPNPLTFVVWTFLFSSNIFITVFQIISQIFFMPYEKKIFWLECDDSLKFMYNKCGLGNRANWLASRRYQISSKWIVFGRTRIR